MSGKRPRGYLAAQRAGAVLDAQPEGAVRVWLRA